MFNSGRFYAIYTHSSPTITHDVVGNWQKECDIWRMSTLEQQHLFAQIAHESANFMTTKEFGGYTYFKRYDGRKDLGNVYPGDGPRFRGRGLIQVTGRHNYTHMMKRLGIIPEHLTGDDLIEAVNAKAELLQEFPYALKTAFIYWRDRPRLKSAAERNDIVGVTKLINGGTNGLRDRRVQLDRAREIII